MKIETTPAPLEVTPTAQVEPVIEQPPAEVDRIQEMLTVIEAKDAIIAQRDKTIAQLSEHIAALTAKNESLAQLPSVDPDQQITSPTADASNGIELSTDHQPAPPEVVAAIARAEQRKKYQQ